MEQAEQQLHACICDAVSRTSRLVSLNVRDTAASSKKQHRTIPYTGSTTNARVAYRSELWPRHILYQMPDQRATRPGDANVEYSHIAGAARLPHFHTSGRRVSRQMCAAWRLKKLNLCFDAKQALSDR